MDYLTLEDEGTAFLSDVGNHSYNDAALHSRGHECSATQL